MLSAFNFLVWEAGSSMRIGMKVSDHCSIIALVSLYPSIHEETVILEENVV